MIQQHEHLAPKRQSDVPLPLDLAGPDLYLVPPMPLRGGRMPDRPPWRALDPLPPDPQGGLGSDPPLWYKRQYGPVRLTYFLKRYHQAFV